MGTGQAEIDILRIADTSILVLSPGMGDAIQMTKARLHSGLTDKEKYEIIHLLVRRALLDGMGNLTIEFKIPQPAIGFGYAHYHTE